MWWYRGVFLLAGIAVALVVLRLIPAQPLAANTPQSCRIIASDGTLLRLTVARDGQYRLWLPLEQMAASTVEALLLKEDRNFFYHPGVNLVSLIRAAWATTIQENKQGGSTLTMQLARRLYRLNTRHVPGKLRQILLALWLESRHSKRELLEAYCNLAPMGGNIEGIPAAARIYFTKDAQELTIAESLALAVLPQNPAKRFDFGPRQQQARRLLTASWIKRHPGQQSLSVADDGDILALTKGHLPFLAPHYTGQLLKTTPGQTLIQATINPALQQMLERIVRHYIRERRQDGITNAAILLVDRRDMRIKALIGSADYNDVSLQGQVNGTLAKRSPGSTLKPLLYALAIDQGLIHPLSVLYDSPAAFGPFQPENFDGRFAGPLTAQDALIRSRNVPAVWLANQLREPNLYGFLRSAGIARLRPESHYGLSLVLGGGELTMEELVSLYAMLANQGLHQPLRWRQDDPPSSGTRLLSPEAAFMVREMLQANPRPGYRQHRARSWPVAWKTGTSWGFRDAWTLGLAGDYVLAVWTGHFDGKANPAFVGLHAAAPLFFRITDALELSLANEQPQPEPAPAGLIKVEVCTASGDLPNHWCPQTVSTWFIPGKSPIRVSTLHRPVVVDRTTGEALCPPYDAERSEIRVFEFWPSDVQRLFAEAGLPRRLPPAATECRQIPDIATTGAPPRMISPLAQVTYTLHLSKPEEAIGLQASIDSDGKQMYWFAGNQYVGSSTHDQTLSWRPPASGRHALHVVDEHGRSAARTLDVDFIP